MIHFIWLGGSMPKDYADNLEYWNAFSELDIKLHTNKPKLGKILSRLWDNAPNRQSQSDLLRYWLMYEKGGIYADVDTRPLRDDIASLIVEHDDFIPYVEVKQLGKSYNNCFIGARTPGSLFWKEVLNLCSIPGHYPDRHPEMPFNLPILWDAFKETPYPAAKVKIYEQHDFLPIEEDGAYIQHFPSWQPQRPPGTPKSSKNFIPLGKTKDRIITKEEEQLRLDTCNACEFLTGERCAKCGCSGRHRSRIASIHCPIDKW